MDSHYVLRTRLVHIVSSYMMKEMNYTINPEANPCTGIGWCGYRFFVIFGVIASIVIYTIGAIVTGVVFHSWSRQANCTVEEYYDEHYVSQQEMFAFNTPLVVVGPCFMAAGGAIILFMIAQWYFCRPTARSEKF
ncbi:hypothetical protein SK128_025592 [Halocaridina rubra]|uniref:Uncharacterized protein n=1 Tax=Halocaridina rubra TaxID=373956 RepID=A0AAN9AA16_HALRR